MSGWKASVLFLASRSIIVHAVTSTIPIYAMQTTKLPISICKETDWLNMNFLWGLKDDKNKVHLVKWMNSRKTKIFRGFENSVL